MAELRSESGGVPSRLETADLTARQTDCLRLAGEGLSSKQIGRALGISPSTVDNHIQTAVTKLHARNRWHAAQLLGSEFVQSGQDSATAHSLVPPPGGRRNTAPARIRLMQIATISAICIVASSGLTVAVLGLLNVLSSR